ncbi:MAG: transcriptional regulator [Frondihabitans sp.]|nr:transcriptional regulator [Frondihabitans sp.]
MDDRAPVTLQDIATAASVSVSTASRALTGRGDLALGTRNRVLGVASKLGYGQRRSLRGRNSSLDRTIVELVLGSFDDAWTAAIVMGARRAAFDRGLDLVLTLAREDPTDDWPARVAARRSCGVVLGLIRPTRRQLATMTAAHVPVAVIDPRSDPRGEVASVGTTDWQGGFDAGKHLVSTGLSTFVVVRGVPRYRFGRAREEGFRQAIAEVKEEAVIYQIDGAWTGADLVRDIAALMKRATTPLGIFACNDDMALACYAAASSLGLRIPHDISVVGFNDEPRAALARPPLTSVHQPLEAMAARAVQLVTDEDLSPRRAFDRIELPSRLIVRHSTLPRLSDDTDHHRPAQTR